MYSINKKFFQKSDEETLNSIEPCKECNEIPIPPYRSNLEDDHYYCKICFEKRNLPIESLIKPSKSEIKMVEKLKISCKFFEKGCSVVYFFREIIQLREHENSCLYSKTSNFIEKENHFHVGKLNHICCRCKQFKSLNHDCYEAVHQQLNNVNNRLECLQELISNQDSKLSNIVISLEEKISSLEGIIICQQEKINYLVNHQESYQSKVDLVIKKQSHLDISFNNLGFSITKTQDDLGDVKERLKIYEKE